MAGVIPRAMADLFASAARPITSSGENSTLTIDVSYLQIYNEKVIRQQARHAIHDAKPLSRNRFLLFKSLLLTVVSLFFPLGRKVYDLLVAPAPPPSKPGSASNPSRDLEVRCIDDVMTAVGR
jgi:hypothetical protein